MKITLCERAVFKLQYKRLITLSFTIKLQLPRNLAPFPGCLQWPKTVIFLERGETYFLISDIKGRFLQNSEEINLYDMVIPWNCGKRTVLFFSCVHC